MAQRIPERKDIPDEHKWNLDSLFSSDTLWDEVFSEVERKLDSYAGYKGRLGESAALFKEAMEFHLSLIRKIEGLYGFAHLKNDEDKSDQKYSGMYQRALNLYTRASEVSSFITPEIQSVPDDMIKSFIEEESLREYAFFLEKVLRYKPHTRSEEVERILSMSKEVADAPSQVFSQLDNVDMRFGTISDNRGEEIELSHGNFSTFLINPNREVRKEAFFQYYKSYENHKHTIAATLSHSVRKDIFYSRVRGFESSLSAALFGDNISESVYNNLIERVKQNLGPLFKYLDFRQKALGLDDLHFYDTYVPIIGEIEFHMSYDEAVDICVTALSPLGSEYTSILEEGLKGGWVDRYENRGKRSGAYSSGTYDSQPYILMNYEENNINSLFTLIHEAGHSMHSYYSNGHQPYIDHSYTIFVAEVASTFNENLLSRYLLSIYKDNPRMEAYIVNREIDNIRGTLFRQTMFAEFEKVIHETAESNTPLTLETLTTTYRELLDVYFGESMVIDNVLALECLRIPHFYTSYYVYKYATGISAAIALAGGVAEGDASARDNYLNFLKLGGSKFPLDELIEAGIDLSSPAPVESCISYFGNLVDRLIVDFSRL